MVFCGRELPLLPEEGPSRGGEDDPPHAILDAVLKEDDRAHYVGACIEERPLSERLTSIWASWWQSAAGTNSLKTSSHPERISISKRCAPSETFPRLPVARSSTPVLSWPRARRQSAMCEPMKPAPPVSKARTSIDLRKHARRTTQGLSSVLRPPVRADPSPGSPSRGLCSGIHTLGCPYRGARATSLLSLQEILVAIPAMSRTLVLTGCRSACALYQRSGLSSSKVVHANTIQLTRLRGLTRSSTERNTLDGTSQDD